MDAGRLLGLFPFLAGRHRVSASLAARRNEFVAAVAERIFFAHISPGGRMEVLRRRVCDCQKPRETLASLAEPRELFPRSASVL